MAWKPLVKSHDLSERQLVADRLLGDIKFWGGEFDLGNLEEWAQMTSELHEEKALLSRGKAPRLAVLQSTDEGVYAWTLIDWLLEEVGGSELSPAQVKGLEERGAQVRGGLRLFG